MADGPRPPPARRGLEAAVVALLGLGAVASVVGAVMALAPEGPWRAAGLAAAFAGLLLFGLATALGLRVPVLRHLRSAKEGGDRYERLRHWNRVRAAGLALQLVVFASAITLAFSLGVRAGLFSTHVADAIVDRGALALVTAIALLAAGAFGISLVTPIEHEPSEIRRVLALLGLTLQGLLAAFGILAQADDRLLAGVGLGTASRSLLLLAGFVVGGVNLAFLRLPPMSVLLTPDGGSALLGTARRGRQIVIPVLGAFALLLVVFLLFVLFGVGFVGILDQVARSPPLLGSLVFLVVALGASAYAAVRLSRSAPDRLELYQPLADPAKVREAWVLAGSALAAALFLAPPLVQAYDPTILDLPRTSWIHFVSAAVLVAVGPYGYLKARDAKRIRRLEERFPDFLRDLASSHKGGLTLTSAVQVAARGEYGPLTPEVRKMADQLSWNVPFTEALDRFAERVRTPLVQRAASLILQANKSGGSTTDVLLAAARDAREIKVLENERRLTMSLYTIVIYVTFLIFLAVVAVMFQRFVPQIVGAGEAVQDSPLGDVEGLTQGGITLEQFRFLYFMAALVQAVGDGILAGMMGAGRANLGLRHSFVMVLCTYVAFALLV